MKSEIRKHMRAMRRQLMPEELAGAGEGVLRQLLALPAFRQATRVACYIAQSDELPTGGIIRHCYGQGQSICAGLATESRDYGFAALDPAAHLTRGPMGIAEPENKRWTLIATVDVFLVPGLAFDARGGRLGHGLGFYDRLLAAARSDSIKVALASEWQVLPELPMEPHDVRMDVVVTEQRTVICQPAAIGRS